MWKLDLYLYFEAFRFVYMLLHLVYFLLNVLFLLNISKDIHGECCSVCENRKSLVNTKQQNSDI